MSVEKIKKLDAHEIQKISAGEVVERPANVLKELLENAVDAGATALSIYIVKSGKSLIRVVDNGSGMSVADAKMCFEPHATSKITTLEDLYSLACYGFRGEALASIASVSTIELVTATESDVTATRITNIHGIITSIEPYAGSRGSDFSVKNLFENVPVRLKFLKKDETEWNQMYDLIQAFALSCPLLDIKLYRDEKLVLNAPPAQTLKDRVCQLWDFYRADQMIELDGAQVATPEFSVRGVISLPSLQRYNRNDIFVFVNGRWIKNQALVKAILKGYAQALPDGRFPVAMIFVTVDPARVDVNVHPRKEEVAFVQSYRIEQAITLAVKATLESNVSLLISRPETRYENTQSSFGYQPHSFERPKSVFLDRFSLSDHAFPPVSSSLQTATRSHATYHTVSDEQDPLFAPSHDQQAALDSRQIVHDSLPFEVFDEPGLSDHQPQHHVFSQKHFLHLSDMPAQSETLFGSATLIGQLFKTYILLDAAEYLLVVDQHAAHERILYERMKHQFEKPDHIPLLVQPLLTLTPQLCAALTDNVHFLEPWGITLEAFGAHQVKLTAFPAQSERIDLEDFFRQIALEIIKHEGELDKESVRKALFEHIHSHTACKAAVKAGDELTAVAMLALIQDLEQVENRHMCIHGRPTLWKLAQKDLAKHFRRD